MSKDESLPKQPTHYSAGTTPNAIRSDVPHKRTNSKIMSPIIDGAKKPLVGGSMFFEAMSTYKVPAIREGIHVTRRRRMSLLSPCSNGNEGPSSGDAENNEQSTQSEQQAHSNIIRRELQLDGTTLALPDPEIHESPEKFLQKIVKVVCDGLELETKKARSLEGFFIKVTDTQIEAYTTTVVSVVRNNDLAALKDLHAKGQVLNCFNRFGESLLHMACRRGFEDIVDFLLDQPDVDVRICDDNGRTVLHDACWNPSPQLKICQRILERDPALLFIADNRGCSAFEYARPEHWSIWRKFLLENREKLKALKHPETLDRLAKAP